MAGRSSSGTGRHAGARSSAGNPSLSDLDHRILGLLSSLRVLTLSQLATISPEIPSRTLRYRTARLAKHGLVGRSRPYRERGSAPHHLWPTRKGEAIAKGEAPPRGGERREPNPLFLAHAAGLSELYVVLKTGLPEGARLAAFDREADARETFTTYAREERAIAPDACIDVAEADGQRLFGFVELDLGTMSHRQLKAKAAGYGEYARLEAWRHRNPFCPALLFITTSEKRARSFLAAGGREIDRSRMLVACVGLARDLLRCILAPEWLVGDGERTTDLLGILCAARRPHDEEEARGKTQRREEEAERDRLRAPTPMPSPSACGGSFATAGEATSSGNRRSMPFVSRSKARAARLMRSSAERWKRSAECWPNRLTPASPTASRRPLSARHWRSWSRTTARSSSRAWTRWRGDSGRGRTCARGAAGWRATSC